MRNINPNLMKIHLSMRGSIRDRGVVWLWICSRAEFICTESKQYKLFSAAPGAMALNVRAHPTLLWEQIAK